MGELEQLTLDARRSLRYARQAAGFPTEDDTGKDVFACAAEAQDVLRRQKEWHAYAGWRRRYRWTWRWRTYPVQLPELPAPYFEERLLAGMSKHKAEGGKR